EREKDCDSDAIEKGTKGDLIVGEVHLDGAARYFLQQPRECWTKQSAKRKVQEIDYPSCGAAQPRRICFLNYGVREHSCTGGSSGDKSKDVRWQDVGTSEEDPSKTSEQHNCSPNDHRFPSADPIRNKTEQGTSNDPSERHRR